MKVTGVLQEAGDTNLRAHTRSQVQAEYFISPYRMSIRLSHLCQGCHDHCVATANDKGNGKVERWFIYVRVWVGDMMWVSYAFYFLFCFFDILNCSFMTGT